MIVRTDKCWDLPSVDGTQESQRDSCAKMTAGPGPGEGRRCFSLNPRTYKTPMPQVKVVKQEELPLIWSFCSKQAFN